MSEVELLRDERNAEEEQALEIEEWSDDDHPSQLVKYSFFLQTLSSIYLFICNLYDRDRLLNVYLN